MAKSKHTIKELRAVLQACARNGIYFEDSLFDLEPETSLKLLDDRHELLDCANRIIASNRHRKDSPTILALMRVVESVEAGWPREPT